MTIATTSVRAPRTVTWMDTIYTINVERYQSGGIVGLFESTVPSQGGPPVHVHHNEDEVIHVIDGTYEFWLDGQITPVAAGASIFLPRGVPHTFQVASERARWFGIGMPAGLDEWFFATGVPAQAPTLPPPPDGPPDVAAIVASLRAYGTETLGPPPGV